MEGLARVQTLSIILPRVRRINPLFRHPKLQKFLAAEKEGKRTLSIEVSARSVGIHCVQSISQCLFQVLRRSPLNALCIMPCDTVCRYRDAALRLCGCADTKGCYWKHLPNNFRRNKTVYKATMHHTVLRTQENVTSIGGR